MNYQMVSIAHPIDELSHREELQNAIRLIGVEKIVSNSDVTKQGIYYALRQNRLPRLLTISRILKSMGLRLAIVVDE